MSSPRQNEIEFVSQLAKQLWPICRSICGSGLRDSLEIVKKEIGLTIHQYKTGTAAFDWVIPQEWRVNNAYIETITGKKIVDFTKNNLHLVNYSTAFEGILSNAELRGHLHSLPSLPDAIPYRKIYAR